MDIGCGEGAERSRFEGSRACKRERLGRWCSCLEAAGSRGAKTGAKPPIRLLHTGPTRVLEPCVTGRNALA